METIDIKKRHFLYTGTLSVRKGEHLLVTVLGSCVSLCLWDPYLKIGGMNHYLLPFWNGEGLSSPKYGNVAIPKLIQKMLALGSEKSSLKAKVFGGSSTMEDSKGLLNVGERNILLAEDLLQEEGIPIISSDVGGIVGRKLIFNTLTGSVLLKRFRMRKFVEKPPFEDN